MRLLLCIRAEDERDKDDQTEKDYYVNLQTLYVEKLSLSREERRTPPKGGGHPKLGNAISRIFMKL